MIESRYWKESLHEIAKSLKPKKNPPRFSERQLCILERDLMIGFFIIRKLIETHKLGPDTIDFKMDVFSCPCTKQDPTWYDNYNFWEAYDVDNEVTEHKKTIYISNQFIHSVTSYPTRNKNRNWDSIYIMSDYDRKKCIWRVPIEQVYQLFLVAYNDYPGIGNRSIFYPVDAVGISFTHV